MELPQCRDANETWYCERVIKEAFMACFQQTQGPVHINVPVVSAYNRYDCQHLPTIRPVHYVSAESPQAIWQGYAKTLREARRILVFVGQDIASSPSDISDMERFFDRYNAVFAVEHHSNLNCQGCIHTYPVTETRTPKEDALVPDLVISIGGNVTGYSMKPFLRRHCGAFRHISVDANGRFRDVFMGLTDLFDCTHSTFFHYFATCTAGEGRSAHDYYDTWAAKAATIAVPDFEFSELCVARYLTEVIPEGATLHTAILNSSRVIQYFPLAKGVKVYSNTGALGIDGCLSTFMGHAAAADHLCFLLTDDLAFFYDMNAAGLRSLGNNVRILMLNNGGGSEFHLFLDKKDVPTMNANICAQHHKTAEGWVKSLGYDYTAVRNVGELQAALRDFATPQPRPMFIEVFTSLEGDAATTKAFYDSFAKPYNVADLAKKVAKKLLKR